MIKIYSLFFITLFTLNVAFAHTELLEKTKVEMEMLQRDLVSKGFLNEKDIKYGVYDDMTERAYDKYKASEVTKRYLESKKEATTSISTSTEVESNKIEKEVSFLEYLFYKVQNFFSNLF